MMVPNLIVLGVSVLFMVGLGYFLVSVETGPRAKAYMIRSMIITGAVAIAFLELKSLFPSPYSDLLFIPIFGGMYFWIPRGNKALGRIRREESGSDADGDADGGSGE